MATIGPIASLIEKLIGFVVDEDQLPEILKRRKLRAAKERCRRALIDNDLDALRVAVDELRDLSAKP